MIISYDLQGSKCRHKGLFETTGLWIRFEDEYCDVDPDLVVGYKIYSQSSFSFYHEDKEIAERVYEGLILLLDNCTSFYKITDIGHIQELS